VANRNSQSVRARRGGRRPTRRDELLGIAAELFADRGFAGVTVDDLGAAAGVSGPALYHHFDSKEALLGEMLIRISESLLGWGQAIVQGHPPEERLAALISMHVDFAVDQRALITVHFRDLVHARAEDEQRVHELQRAYVDIWVAAVLHDRPSMGPRMARAAVHAAFGLINSTPFSGRLRREDMVDLLRTMAAGALSAVGGSELREH
jgi:AcrR family transcriptional regulator